MMLSNGPADGDCVSTRINASRNTTRSDENITILVTHALTQYRQIYGSDTGPKTHLPTAHHRDRPKVRCGEIGSPIPLLLQNHYYPPYYHIAVYSIFEASSPLSWSSIAKTNFKKLDILQLKTLRIISDASWFVQNDHLCEDMGVSSLKKYTVELAKNTWRSSESDISVIGGLRS